MTQRSISNAGVRALALPALATLAAVTASGLAAVWLGVFPPVWESVAPPQRALAWDIALFSAGIGSTLLIQLLLLKRNGLPAALFRTLSPAEAEQSGERLGAQLATALQAFRAHSETTGRYAQSLKNGRSRLQSADDAARARSAVKFLLDENSKMVRANTVYQGQLVESARQLDFLRSELLQARQENERDALTNAYSRRHFDVTLAQEVGKAGQGDGELSLIMADIDHFKRINDTHGHLVGDELLRHFAALLAQMTKGKDCVARYGGEEFAIIMPTTPLDAAAAVAEHIRKKLDGTHWRKGKDGAPIGVMTASFGVAQLARGEGAQGLIERSDAKLYLSKNSGRNCVSK